MKKIILLVSLVTIAFFGCKNNSSEYINKLEQKIKEDSLKNVAEMQTMKSEMQARLDSMQQACGDCIGSFYVVTGSFREPQNADNYLAEMKKQGLKAQIIVAPNGFHLVCTYCGQNLKDVLGALQSARNNVQPESWVYIK